MESLEFERDAGLRSWEVYAPSNDLRNGFAFQQVETGQCRLEITDNLVKELLNQLRQVTPKRVNAWFEEMIKKE